MGQHKYDQKCETEGNVQFSSSDSEDIIRPTLDNNDSQQYKEFPNFPDKEYLL